VPHRVRRGVPGGRAANRLRGLRGRPDGAAVGSPYTFPGSAYLRVAAPAQLEAPLPRGLAPTPGREPHDRAPTRPTSAPPPHLQAFSCWVHLCVVRLFVECILRYGLPPQFQAVVVKPLPKMETRLRAVLASAFGTGEKGRAAPAGRRGRKGWDLGQPRWRRACAGFSERHYSEMHVGSLPHVITSPALLLCMPPAPTDAPLLHACACPCLPPDSEYWREDLAGGAGGMATSEIDAYPYVSLTVNTDA
jgi:hypothetical protein